MSADGGFPPDELVLAAVERAATDSPEWLREACEGAAFAHEIARHLDLPTVGRGSRWLPRALARLARAGMVAIVEPSGRKAFILAPDADAWLHALDSVGELPALPESPVHRHWREASEASERHLPAAREELRRAAGEALRMVNEAPTAIDSDAWETLGKRLERACETLESITHCLYEWPEPDDQREEVPFATAMKRATWLWDTSGDGR